MRIDGLKKYFSNLPEVRRVQELEPYIDHNEKIQALVIKIKDKQKQMVNAREFHQPKQYAIYQEEYNNLKNQLMDLPFVEEYIEALEMAYQKLRDLKIEIEQELNHSINI